MIHFIVVSSFFLQDYISFISLLVFFFLVFSFGVVVFLIQLQLQMKEKTERRSLRPIMGWNMNDSSEYTIHSQPWRLTVYSRIMNVGEVSDGERGLQERLLILDLRASHRFTLDLWLAKDNRFLNPKSSYKRILMAPPCRHIQNERKKGWAVTWRECHRILNVWGSIRPDNKTLSTFPSLKRCSGIVRRIASSLMSHRRLVSSWTPH